MTHRSRMLDWTMAAFIAVWGLAFLAPGVTIGISPAYGLLASVASEEVWGAAFVIVGLLRMAALIRNGRSPRGSPLLRGLTALLGASVWGVLTAAFVLYSLEVGAWHTGVSYAVLTVADILATGRSARDFAAGHLFLKARAGGRER